MSNHEDLRFKHNGVTVRVSNEAWTDEDMLNHNKGEAIQIAVKKIAAGNVQDGEILITSNDVITNRE